jgi:hypothetical protein
MRINSLRASRPSRFTLIGMVYFNSRLTKTMGVNPSMVMS